MLVTGNLIPFPPRAAKSGHFVILHVKGDPLGGKGLRKRDAWADRLS